ncbi:MAG: hypothetical protein NTY90_01770 [Candidatus Micrarchaeota archaeon]|nr:hypothetical protein [Candidatus Micrarchaeota archaeon]
MAWFRREKAAAGARQEKKTLIIPKEALTPAVQDHIEKVVGARHELMRLVKVIGGVDAAGILITKAAFAPPTRLGEIIPTAVEAGIGAATGAVMGFMLGRGARDEAITNFESHLQKTPAVISAKHAAQYDWRKITAEYKRAKVTGDGDIKLYNYERGKRVAEALREPAIELVERPRKEVDLISVLQSNLWKKFVTDIRVSDRGNLIIEHGPDEKRQLKLIAALGGNRAFAIDRTAKTIVLSNSTEVVKNVIFRVAKPKAPAPPEAGGEKPEEKPAQKTEASE